MKLKFLNKIALAFLCGALNASAGEFSWSGDHAEILPGKPSDPLLVNEGPGSRSVRSLRFENTEDAAEEGTGGSGRHSLQVSDLSLEPVSNEFTIACFVYPERRKLNEDILASKTDSRSDVNGYRLFKNWDNWGLELGNGAESKRFYSTSKLTMDSWQHLAAVVKDGQVTFYHDGIPTGQKPMELDSIIIPDRVFVGSGPRGVLAFRGLITGIHISDAGITEEQIIELMRRITE